MNGCAALSSFRGWCIYHARKPPKDREPGRKKYSRKEKENAHFYIRKIKSIPPQKQAPEGFLENWFPWSLFVQKGKEEMTKEERKKRVQEAWKKLKTTSRDSKEFKEALTTWNKLDTEYLIRNTWNYIMKSIRESFRDELKEFT